MAHYFTDGSASPNPGPGGYAVILDGQPVALGREANSTNIRMEAQALIAAYKIAKAGDKISTDSEFWVNVVTKWATNWQKNGWKKKTGDKFMLQPKGSPVTWLCGLYRIEEGLPCYVILTREPSEEIRFIHDRMPLMLPDQCIDEWINPNANPAEIIQKAQTDILYERVS